MTAEDYQQIVEVVLTDCRGDEFKRRVYLLARRLEKEWGRL